jgi:hypothetical protein
MAATIEISESNGASPTVTASITNTNMGSTDAVNLDPATYPITAGANSYEKWQRFHVNSMGGSSKIQTLKVWASAALASAATLFCSATFTSYNPATPYHTPVATASNSTPYIMMQTTPATNNLGIGGVLGAATFLCAATPYSDYLVMQIQTTVSAVAGTTITINYQYDEVA